MDKLNSVEHTLSNIGIKVDAFSGSLEISSRDASQLNSPPVCLIYPSDCEQIAKTVLLCVQHRIPVTVAGGYTGLSGGALGYSSARIETKHLNKFEIRGSTVFAEAGASIPEIIRATAEKGYVFPIQPASACRSEDVYEYLGTRIGPVTVGGSLGANASGLVGCKLGAALEWVEKLTVVLPSGKIEEVSEKFERFVGTEGKYGIITDAVIKLASLPENMRNFLVSGTGYESFAGTAEAIGRSSVLPLLAEAIVQTENPPDLKELARRIFPDASQFLDSYTTIFEPEKWFILLQCTIEEMEECRKAVNQTVKDTLIREISKNDFLKFKQIRSAASDEIGCGICTPHASAEKLEPPVKRAAAFLEEAINEFGKRGLKPKGEHNLGILRVFLESKAEREKYNRDIKEGLAFDDGSPALYSKCKGKLRIFLEQFLSPVISRDMIKKKEAVNFPGNEDILIRAEQFPETMHLLNGLMEKYDALPVPLYYCHINFRKQPGWILVHNRLLIDVNEFK